MPPGRSLLPPAGGVAAAAARTRLPPRPLLIAGEATSAAG